MWRAAKNAAKFREVWEKEIPGRGKVVTRRLPPRPVRGRWEAATNCENAFLMGGFKETSTVFSIVLGQGRDGRGQGGRGRGRRGGRGRGRSSSSCDVAMFAMSCASRFQDKLSLASQT